MQCEYCKDELLEGATVCRACARRQPLPPEKRDFLWLAAGSAVFALVVLGWGGYALWVDDTRSAAIDRLVARSRLCSDNPLSRGFIESQIDYMRDHGASWDMAYKVMDLETCGHLSD